MTTGATARVLYWRGMVLMLILATLAGCTDKDRGSQLLNDYLNRLSRATDQALAPPTLIAPPRLTDAGLELLEVETASIGVLDFLSLSGCALQVNLGRRNSSLGRSASASQRLLLDIEFLALAPDCIKVLQASGDDSLAQVLQEAVDQRRREIPKRIYNAVLAGPEFRAFWQLPTSLEDYPANVSGDVIDAMQRLAETTRAWLAGEYRLDYPLETDLALLRTGDGGALLLAAATQARLLKQATTTLRQRRERAALCPGGRETESARITQTVVTRYFAKGAQPWLAQVNRRRQVVSTAVDTLETLLDDTLPPEYRVWRDQREALLHLLTETPKAHVAAVKQTLAGCPNLAWSSH